MLREEEWVSDPADKKIQLLRAILTKAIEEQSKHSVNYYDFLLVAKKLNFRFEESSHLMALRKHFFKFKNNLPTKKLVNLLEVSQQSLHEMKIQNGIPDKIIVKFNVSSAQFQAIKQVTNEDEEFFEEQSENENFHAMLPKHKKQFEERTQSKNEVDENSQEFKEKMTIILSIKVTQMLKKIKALVAGTQSADNEDINIFSTFQNMYSPLLPYEVFKKGIITLLRKLDSQPSKDRITLSEDDIKAIFYILDQKHELALTTNDLQALRLEDEMTEKITKFYQTRINRKMVKNTLFKLGKVNSSIQIYQVKNASLLQFKKMQDSMIDDKAAADHMKEVRQRMTKSRTPHFGPIKGFAMKQSTSREKISEGKTQRLGRQHNSSLGTYKKSDESNLDKEREKIERIIRTSKEDKKKKTGHDTISSKLRKLFIHKVILPREKLLEEEKAKYTQIKTHSTKLMIKFN